MNRKRIAAFLVASLASIVLSTVFLSPQTIQKLSGKWSFSTVYLFAPERTGASPTANYYSKQFIKILSDYLVSNATISTINFVSSDIVELQFLSGPNFSTPLRGLYEWNQFPEDFGNILTIYPKSATGSIRLEVTDLDSDSRYLVSYSNLVLNKSTSRMESMLVIAIITRQQ